MSNETVYIKGVGIKEEDIIFIKFKPLSEIIKFYQNEGYSGATFLQESQCDSHLTAILEGGYFRVQNTATGNDRRNFPQDKILKRADNNKKPQEISIDNHLAEDSDYFSFNETIVESIRVEHDAQESYFSDKFGISLMKIDGALYINNERVQKSDTKLLDILESTISDLAIQRMLEDSKDKNSDDDY